MRIIDWSPNVCASDLMKTKAAPLKHAISVATSQAKLAVAITAAGRRCTQQTISYWLKELDGEIPAEWCPYIESATGIARARLRADIFGPSPNVAARRVA